MFSLSELLTLFNNSLLIFFFFKFSFDWHRRFSCWILIRFHSQNLFTTFIRSLFRFRYSVSFNFIRFWNKNVVIEFNVYLKFTYSMKFSNYIGVNIYLYKWRKSSLTKWNHNFYYVHQPYPRTKMLINFITFSLYPIVLVKFIFPFVIFAFFFFFCF